jgi:antitoxin component YwqK of YwqJK toxin-antitoxin module
MGISCLVILVFKFFNLFKQTPGGITKPMRQPIFILLVSTLCLVGCSGDKKRVEEKEREVSLAQIRETEEGIVFVKGEKEPFTGRLVVRYTDGTMESVLNIVAGQNHGTFEQWHADGQKDEKATWVNGLKEGMARGWYASGKKRFEYPFRADKFHGTVKRWNEDGRRMVEVYENGLKEGVARGWFASGKKQFEMSYRADKLHGTATQWNADGSRTVELLENGVLIKQELWRGAERVKVVDVAKVRAETERLAEERRQLDATVWKDETQAQLYEDTFVTLWDELRSAKDKWEPFREFALESIALGKKSGTTEHDWDIRAVRYQGGGAKLNAADWHKWLKSMADRGIEVVETEWHHEEFIPSGEGTSSVVRFVVHATGPEAMRYIVRGKLRVAWTKAKDARGHIKAGHINVTEAVVFSRQGRAPFELLPYIVPGAGQPAAVPGAGGSRPHAMPMLVYDLNRDGLSEIVLARANLVYRNEGRMRFKRELLCKHYPGRLQAAVFADFDNDGLTDLLGLPEDSMPVFMKGGAGGVFNEPPKVIEVKLGAKNAGTCITAGDIDNDGDLDAWVIQNKSPYDGGHMPTPYYDANDGYPSYLLVNDGKGRFTDQTEAAGLAAKRFRRSYSASFVDLDEDTDLDLIVVSDFAGLDVYLNDGKGHFTDVTGRLGNTRYSFGMSHALADFNGDGKLDLYMVGMGSTTARRLERLKLGRKEFPEHQKARMRMAYGNRLFLGGARGVLKQAAYNDLVARTGWAWGCTSFDFDNDGDLDLYIANGNISGRSAKDHCTTFWRHDIYSGTSKDNLALDELFTLSQECLDTISWNGFEHNVLLMNESRDSFLNVSFLMNTALEFDSRAIVGDDLDGDGRVDLLVIEKYFIRGSAKVDYLHILHNKWERPGHWVGVRLHEHGRGFSPVGARITVTAGGRRQFLPVVTGDSFRAQHSNQKHFGLGTVDKVEAIEVRWPNGKISRLENPAVNQYHEVKPE